MAVDVIAMGKVGLGGWRSKLGERVAPPVAEKTRLSEDQVKALLGGIFLLLAIWQFVRLVGRVVRAGRGAEVA